MTISFEEVFPILDTDVFTKTQRRLKDVERFVLWGAWKEQTYDEMAKASDYRYTAGYLKQDIGPKLWKLLSKTLEEEVSKTNFRAALERRVRLQAVLDSQKQLKNLKIAENTAFSAVLCQFFGRWTQNYNTTAMPKLAPILSTAHT